MEVALAVCEASAGRGIVSRATFSFVGLVGRHLGDVRSDLADQEAAREGGDPLRQLPEEVGVGPFTPHGQASDELCPSSDKQGVVRIVRDALVVALARKATQHPDRQDAGESLSPGTFLQSSH